MIVNQSQIRELLWKGLWEVSGDYSLLTRQWHGVFVPKAPAIITTEVGLPAAVALAAAATIIRNPVMTRRFWSGWGRDVNKS